MFDKDMMDDAMRALREMSPAQKKKRAGELAVLLEAEIKRRDAANAVIKEQKANSIIEMLKSLRKK